MAQAENKPSIIKRGQKYFREMKSELKKVIWPTRSQLMQNAGVVGLCCLIIGAFVWVFDAIGGLFVQGLISLFS